MALKLVTPPAITAVSVAQAKSYLRISGTSDDAMLELMIAAATEQLEMLTSRRFITSTWRYTRDQWPHVGFRDPYRGLDYMPRQGAIQDWVGGNATDYFELPIYPIIAITSFKTFDNAAAETTVNPLVYSLDTHSQPARIKLNHAMSWPTTAIRSTNGIEVVFTAGYGSSAESVPAGLRQAILDLVAHYYQNRGCDPDALPAGVQSLIAPYMIYRIG